jgi:hypothetical protein
VIIAGCLNMIWCKLDIFKLSIPIDRGIILKDGNRLFGDNKTWNGFFGYIYLNLFCTVIYGYITNKVGLNYMNFLYTVHINELAFNVILGILYGLAYAVFELPNSFFKRRLGIIPGKTINGFKKIFFVCLDQADSIFGVCLVVWLLYPLGIKLYLLYVLIGMLTHLVINMLLYFLHLRKNMF